MGFVGFVLCMKYETTRDGVIFIQPSWDLILEMKHREKDGNSVKSKSCGEFPSWEVWAVWELMPSHLVTSWHFWNPKHIFAALIEIGLQKALVRK